MLVDILRKKWGKPGAIQNNSKFNWNDCEILVWGWNYRISLNFHSNSRCRKMVRSIYMPETKVRDQQLPMIYHIMGVGWRGSLLQFVQHTKTCQAR